MESRVEQQVRPRAARVWFAAALFLHLLFLVSLGTGWLDPLCVEASQGHGQASDFFGIYQAGANLIAGHSIYDSEDYRHEAPLAVPYYYFYRYLPPTAYAAGLFAALLPPWPAYWVWVCYNELLLALILLSLARTPGVPASRRWVASGLWLACFPLYIEQFMGQFSLTMAALLWLFWRYDRLPATTPPTPASAGVAEQRAANPPRPSLAGSIAALAHDWRRYRWRADRLAPHGPWLAWSASLVLKSFSAMLALPILRDRQLKRLLLAAGLGLLVCLPYFLARPADLIEFARLNFNPFTPAVYKGAFGLQTWLHDLTARLPQAWHASALALLGREISAAKLLQLAPGAVVLLLAVAATLRLRARPDRRALDLAIWTAVFLLIFKSVWEYHYLMILPALSALYLRTGARSLILWGGLFAAPTLYAAAPLIAGVASAAPLDDWPGWFRSLHFSVKVIPTIGLFAWCIRQTWRPGQGALARSELQAH